ncbi:KEOPS complex subunit Pcc1 [Thermococcus gorgonarius]|uniref:KEOPS complex subunit n=1 Tax=Thermococcus gorgonarius TaxID=71997 RepID=A0A2Z2M9H1_THEGO|nr:KEOPS complex subunit Pcc1 [Thermococcus gorgonarius]ASJ00574.1 KEOPS complex subunit [Thermococcus gorgonarius]
MKIRVEAEIVWHYGDARKAEAIARAVQVDNEGIPESLKKSLNLETRWDDGTVRTKVKYSGEIDTLIKALDDLVFSVKIAEEMTEKV